MLKTTYNAVSNTRAEICCVTKLCLIAAIIHFRGFKCMNWVYSVGFMFSVGFGYLILVSVTLDCMSSVLYYTKQGDMELLHTSIPLIHPT